MSLRNDTSPKPGDSTNVLLAKIAQLIGGGGTGSGSSSYDLETLTYSASVVLDFSTDAYKTLSLTGDVTFASTNLSSVKPLAIRIVADGTDRALSFPASWVFLTNSAPASIAAGKTAILSVTSFGSTDADVVAAYAVEA